MSKIDHARGECPICGKIFWNHRLGRPVYPQEVDQYMLEHHAYQIWNCYHDGKPVGVPMHLFDKENNRCFPDADDKRPSRAKCIKEMQKLAQSL